MEESKASAAIQGLVLGKPHQEKQDPAVEPAAKVVQGLGKVSCDGSTYSYEVKRGLRGVTLTLSKHAKIPHKGEAMDFMSVRNRVWRQDHLG